MVDAWPDAQIVVRDGVLLRAGTRATRNTELTAPAGAGTPSGTLDKSADPEERGGRAAAAMWSKAAKKANWKEIVESVHGPQCEDCAEEKMFGRCERHRKTADHPEPRWWHGTHADPGLAALDLSRRRDRRGGPRAGF